LQIQLQRRWAVIERGGDAKDGIANLCLKSVRLLLQPNLLLHLLLLHLLLLQRRGKELLRHSDGIGRGGGRDEVRAESRSRDMVQLLWMMMRLLLHRSYLRPLHGYGLRRHDRLLCRDERDGRWLQLRSQDIDTLKLKGCGGGSCAGSCGGYCGCRNRCRRRCGCGCRGRFAYDWCRRS